MLSFLVLLPVLLPYCTSSNKIDEFYVRLKKEDVKRCPDPTKLLPDCHVCIPGLKKASGSDTCGEFVDDSKTIRDEIARLTKDRYGPDLDPSRKFGLYPCEFMVTSFNGLILNIHDRS